MYTSQFYTAQSRIRIARKDATFLDLADGDLEVIPNELWQFKNLRRLDLYQNNLSDIPGELEQLQNLTELFVQKNRLVSLPKELGQLQKLKRLYLHQNQLSSIPGELGRLQNLVELYLYENKLDSLPKELGRLKRLKQLDLYQNQLVSLPNELGQLQGLVELYLYKNQLTSLPEGLGKLHNLTRLDLSENKLNSLPKELGNLQDLTELYLAKNRLSSLPKELGKLQNLTQLDLSCNQLTNLPHELGNLQNLKRLDLSQNPDLVFPPPEVIVQGTQAILAYLREQQKEGERQWLSKMLVVGEGGVGKTSLLRALRRESFEVQQSSTHGIEIKTLNLAHPTEVDVTMTLNTWDFGGQEIYHATHQFFLTNRSLFLLAFNARLGYEQGKLVYWLKTIRANAPESPVILVATWADERDADLPLSDLKEQFPQVQALYEISNKTGQGVQELQQAITTAAAELPLMGEIWPATWLRFSNLLRKSPTKQTTPRKFWEVMAQAKVSEEGRSVLANWLHELGDILFFQDDDDVNDLVILKPQWVTEYISKVVTAEEVIKRNGLFTRQCMNQVWSELKPGLRDFFLRLMERFDLSYRTLENRDISLVVERLPFEPPDLQSLWEQKLEEPNCKEISMKFQVSEILPGIPTWFIARQHRFTIDQGERRGIHWRTGVLFRDREGKHLGLVRTLRDDNTNADYLHLTVRGPVPHNFFDVLREGLELTLRRYPGLKVTRLLPCPDPAQFDCFHEFDYANLARRLERTPPRETIECPNCLENVSVTRLLFGLHYTTQDAVIAKIDEFQASTEANFEDLQETVTEGFTELRELVQRDVLREIRTVQKQIESPCPSVFVLRPDDRPVWQKDIGSQRINLQLYCEHPGCLHPVQHGGLYSIDNPKPWLRAMAPHINRLFSILKYVTPVVGPWVNLSAPIYSDLIKNDLALTNALVKKLPDIQFDEDDRSFIDSDEPGRKPYKISDAALRTLHEFLKEKDPDQVWGNLTRTTTPEGDVLWLCKEHIKEVYPTSNT